MRRVRRSRPAAVGEHLIEGRLRRTIAAGTSPISTPTRSESATTQTTTGIPFRYDEAFGRFAHSAGRQRPQDPRADADAGKASQCRPAARLRGSVVASSEPARAKRQSRGQFARPRARPRERQIRDVDALRSAARTRRRPTADRGCGGRCGSGRPGAASRRCTCRARSKPNCGKRLKVRGIQRVDLRLDLLDRGVGPEPPDVEEAIARARVVRLLRRR